MGCEHYQSLELGENSDVFDPKCVVVIGHGGNELTDNDRRKSFGFYRSQLSDVLVITYDELVQKTQNLIKILEDVG